MTATLERHSVVGRRGDAAAYAKRYRFYLARTGRPIRVDAAPSRRLIDEWLVEGWSYRQIADAAGVSRKSISGIHQGQASTHPRIAAAIRHATPATTTVGRRTYIDATGTRRRLQALTAIGHPVAAIAPALGLSLSGLQRLILGHHTQVSAATAQASVRLYDAWSMHPGTSARAQGIARKYGWASPLAWDDEDIEDPDATPNLGEPTPHGISTLLENATWLLAAGASLHETAQRLGVTPQSIDRARYRARQQPPTPQTATAA